MRNNIKKFITSFTPGDFPYGLVVIFIVAFGVFFYIQYTPAFPDPDSFYHMKMSLLIRDGNLAQGFPWLSDYTILGEAYTDQHFLYHVFLIPFVSLFEPAIGIKIATVFLGAALITIFYWFLKKEKIRFAGLYSLLLLFVEPFTFRISLAKAPSVSLIFLLIILWCLFRYRSKYLFIASTIFVWAYGGFLLAVVLAGAFWLVSVIYDLFKNRSSGLLKKFFGKQKPWIVRVFIGKEFGLLLVSILGVLVGLVVNPYFPNNLSYYWSQLVQIGIVNYQNVIGVGGEWYPYSITELIPNTVFLFLILLAGLIVYFITFKKQDKRSTTLLLLAIFFLSLTLKSRRYVEYFVPFAMLFGAFALNPILARANIPRIIKKLPSFYNSRKIVFTLLLVYFIVTIPTIALRDLKQERNSFESGIQYNKFESASKWLKQNTPKDSIVLHSDWDEFPILFYHNSHNRYIVGLDPTFMYVHNEDKYWKWVNITIGEESDNLYDIITKDFQNATVFLEKDHNAMDLNFQRDSHFKLVYEDVEAKIYQIQENE
ncbi:hypothetical protein HON22_00980 [Candidatus Peregrinibacteria bacterium]|jgi:hypothetical protein|nr:hypothetical protein [Candidatus Peregrinibacteria bacterium]